MSPSALAFCSASLAPSMNSPARPSWTPARAKVTTRERSRDASIATAPIREETSVPRRRHVPSGCRAGNPVSVIGIG